MTFNRKDEPSGTLLRIQGALDAVSAPEIRPVIDAIIEERRSPVTVDLSELRLIDSSGIGAIVSLYKRLKAAGGTMTVIGLSNQPLAIFKLLRLERLFADAR